MWSRNHRNNKFQRNKSGSLPRDLRELIKERRSIDKDVDLEENTFVDRDLRCLPSKSHDESLTDFRYGTETTSRLSNSEERDPGRKRKQRKSRSIDDDEPDEEEKSKSKKKKKKEKKKLKKEKKGKKEKKRRGRETEEEHTKSLSRDSSLSLSLSPSPERKEQPCDTLPSISRTWRPPSKHDHTRNSRSPHHSYTRESSNPSRCERNFSPKRYMRRSRSPPRTFQGNRRPYLPYERDRRHYAHRHHSPGRIRHRSRLSDPVLSNSLYNTEDRNDWESKVEAFVENLKAKDTSTRDPPPPGTEHSKQNPQPGAESTEEDTTEEDFTATPLIRYVGKNLTKKGGVHLRLEGVFQYNLLSFLTRSEWVAAKTIKLLEEAGFMENSFYFLATTKGGDALANDLKESVFDGRVKLGNRADLVPQVIRVIDLIVKYYTSSGDDEKSESEEAKEKCDESSDKGENKTTSTASNPIRAGVAAVLQEIREEESKKQPEQVESDPKPEINLWSRYNDHIQITNLESLMDMKSYIGKNLLRTSDPELSTRSKAFEIAQEMVSCLALAEYSSNSLFHLVYQTPIDDILPPKELCLIGHDGKEQPRKVFLYDKILDRLYRMRNQFPPLSDKQIQYLVRMALQYAMRGCDKMPTPAKTPSGTSIVFNYLPEGLREMENALSKRGTQDREDACDKNEELTVNDTLEDGQTPVERQDVIPEAKESTDPLNSILTPGQNVQTSNPNVLPNRKYLTGCVHTEWLVLKGKPEIFEIGVYMSDMTSITVYTVPEALQKQPEIMEDLGFYSNPDRNEIYFVQMGIGCVKTLPLPKAIQIVGQFLEEKRNSTSSENKNNGLILNFYTEEEMAIVVRTIEKTGNKNLLLDIIKGFGCVEHFIERFRSKKMTYSGPKYENSGEECFFYTEVRRALSAKTFVTKRKSEALFQALEFFLEEPVSYKNFIQNFCYPSFSPKVQMAKKKLKQTEELYNLELFMAAELKNQNINLFLEGVFQPQLGKELRDKASVVASRVCRILVDSGLDKSTLAKRFKQSPEFTINSSIFLDKMSIAQRLRVTDQTMRCISIIRHYFRPAAENSEDNVD